MKDIIDGLKKQKSTLESELKRVNMALEALGGGHIKMEKSPYPAKDGNRIRDYLAQVFTDGVTLSADVAYAYVRKINPDIKRHSSVAEICAMVNRGELVRVDKGIYKKAA